MASKTTEAPSETGEANTRQLYIIGIGASAGRLEAIREFTRHMPKEVPAAYIVAQHVSPGHTSLLTTLIQREAALPVEDAEDGKRLETNTIYVTPPNSDVLVKNECLVLQPPSSKPATPKPSVDRLFTSIAEDAENRAVGIVLSGTGSDGSYGVQNIRAAGGITIALDDRTAKYDRMPISAVETGCTDLVLSPAQIGTHLAKILAQPRDLEQFKSEEIDQHPSPISCRSCSRGRASIFVSTSPPLCSAGSIGG